MPYILLIGVIILAVFMFKKKLNFFSGLFGGKSERLEERSDFREKSEQDLDYYDDYNEDKYDHHEREEYDEEYNYEERDFNYDDDQDQEYNSDFNDNDDQW